MSDKFEEIRARHKEDELWRNSPAMRYSNNYPQSHDDRGYLLSEVERLKEKLLDVWATSCSHSAALDKAEVERMREALRKIASQRHYGEECWNIARKALEGAP